MSNRRIQERDKQRLDRVQPEEELQWQKKIQEDEKQKREEITKKKESEDKGKQEMQEKLSKLFQPHQEPVKPAVQAPWSNAGRVTNQETLLHMPLEQFFSVLSSHLIQKNIMFQDWIASLIKVNHVWIELWTPKSCSFRLHCSS